MKDVKKKRILLIGLIFILMCFLGIFLLGLERGFKHGIMKGGTALLGILVLISIIWTCLKSRIEGNKYRLGKGKYLKSRMDLEKRILELQHMISYTGVGWIDNYHLVLEGQNNSDYKRHAIEESIAERFGIVDQLAIQEKKAFMLMPFNYEAAQAFIQCRESLEVFGIELKKSDDEFIQGDLLKNIVKHIITSNIIIANLDGKSPNVFYELGIAHALGKKTILIATSKDVPFNVQSNYILFYRSLDELDRKVQEAVKQILKKYEQL